MTQVLLVEPDKLLAQTYSAALKAAHISAQTAPGAQGAITIIDKKHPKLIVLELQLASHNGVEFLYELRSHSDLQSIPVLLHTIIPLVDVKLSTQTKEQLGIMGYLYKPQTSLEQLIDEVKQILAKQKDVA